jgi:hypothetical protein
VVSSDSRARDHRADVVRQPDAAERGHIGEDLEFSLPPMPAASLAGGFDVGLSRASVRRRSP